MRHLETVERDIGATGRGEDLVAWSVVVEVGGAADTHTQQQEFPFCLAGRDKLQTNN